MLFARRKRPTAVEPDAADRSAPSNGDTAAADADIPTLEVPTTTAPGGHDPEPAGDLTAPWAPAPPVAPVSAAVSSSSSNGTDARPPAAERERHPEPTEDDLERFFAALRQVVQDAHDRLPLEHEPGDDADEPDAASASGAAPAVTPSETPSESPSEPASEQPPSEGPGTLVPATVPHGTTEVAPSTAELIASLEADRDRWRERAVVWRERAMGADMLVKTLNAHMSDLQINLDDLRTAMRLLGGMGSTPEETPAIPAPGAQRGVINRFLEPGR